MMRFTVIFVMLAATAAGHYVILHSHEQAATAQPVQDVFQLPRELGEFQQVGADAEPEQEVKDSLQTNSILMRTYGAPGGRSVQLTIVHAISSRGSLHFPEVCLVGQGWEVSEQIVTPVGFSHTAKRLVIINGDRQEAVLYWFKTGDRFTGNFFLNTWNYIWDTLNLRAPETSLIRMSTRVRRDKQEAFGLLEEFAGYLTPLLRMQRR